MRLQPIVYTANMDRTVEWYRKVLDADPSYSSDVWTSIPVGDATLGIHLTANHVPESNVELSLIATESLESLTGRLAAAGVIPQRGIQDEAFGRSLVLEDPDGSLVQINEHRH